jgi:hypothetical protein
MHKLSSRNRSGEIILIEKEVQGRGHQLRGGHIGEGEEGFVKDDISRNKNVVRLKLKTLVALCVLRSSQETRIEKCGVQVVGCCSRHVGGNKHTQKLLDGRRKIGWNRDGCMVLGRRGFW